MATIKDVARLAGVGLGTASRAISGRGPVSEKALAKVNDAVATLQFRPSNVARALASKTLGMVGIYVPDFSGSGLIESPVKAIEMWRLEFDAVREAGACFVLTNHPFLSGRPSRAKALDGLISYVCSHDDVWVASLNEIASHVRGLGLTPRSVDRPDERDF